MKGPVEPVHRSVPETIQEVIELTGFLCFLFRSTPSCFLFLCSFVLCEELKARFKLSCLISMIIPLWPRKNVPRVIKWRSESLPTAQSTWCPSLVLTSTNFWSKNMSYKGQSEMSFISTKLVMNAPIGELHLCDVQSLAQLYLYRKLLSLCLALRLIGSQPFDNLS